MSNPSEWMQIHFNDVHRNELPPPITTAAITTPTAATSRNSNPSLDQGQGRVARPIRRRSRASRRTPTTLLNTDTTNFRAMVQQFTGSPNTTTYAARPQPSNATGIYDFMQHAASASAPTSGFRVQYPNQIEQQHMLMIDNMLGHGGGSLSSHAPPESSSANEDRDYDMF